MSSYPSTPLAKQLWNACCYGDIHDVAAATDAGADVNFEGLHGWTPLILCVIHDRLDSLRLLLDLGADPNLSDNCARGPAASAAALDRIEMLQLLIDRGADVDAVDREGLTALESARREGAVRCEQLLRSILERRELDQGVNQAPASPALRM
jgi:ankyrin repeat protein